MERNACKQQIPVQVGVDFACALAHHHHSLDVVQQARILSMVVAHRSRPEHQSVLLVFIKTEAQLLKVLIFESIYPAEDVFIHRFRRLRRSLEEVRPVYGLILGTALDRVEHELVLALILLAPCDYRDDHSRPDPAEALHLIR